jgi:hypothetical protein
MDKAALLERLVRLGATDVPGTPRLLMRHRTPGELGQLQQSVEGAFKRVQDPVKQRVGRALSGVPGGKLLQRGANLLIDNPEALPMQAVPIPGLTPAYLGAKKGLEHLIDRVAPAKLAAGSVDEFLFKLAALGVGQWWEQVGGPHLAKGGSHQEFKKMMEAEGLPPKLQEKFMRVAKEKYPSGFRSRRAGNGWSHPPGPWSAGQKYKDWESSIPKDEVPRYSFHVPASAANIAGGALAAGLGTRLAIGKSKDDPYAASQKWKGRLGAYLSMAPLPYIGHSLGKTFGGTKGGILGGLAGAGLGGLVAEGSLRQQEERARTSGQRAARTAAGQKRILEEEIGRAHV